MVPRHTSFFIHDLNAEIHTRKTFSRKKLLLYTNTATLEMVWTRKAFEDFFLISSQRKRKKKDKIESLSMGKKFWGESSTEREAVVRQWPEGTIWLCWIFQHMNLADRKHGQNCPQGCGTLRTVACQEIAKATWQTLYVSQEHVVLQWKLYYAGEYKT